MIEAIKVTKHYNEIAPYVQYITEGVKHKKTKYLANPNSLLGDLRVQDSLDGTAIAEVKETDHHEGNFHIILDCKITHNIKPIDGFNFWKLGGYLLLVSILSAYLIGLSMKANAEEYLLQMGCKVYTKYGDVKYVEIDGVQYDADKEYNPSDFPFAHTQVLPSECRYVSIRE